MYYSTYSIYSIYTSLPVLYNLIGYYYNQVYISVISIVLYLLVLIIYNLDSLLDNEY